jgi:RimJ/RimL family protein N-acetyltransferase
MNRRELSDGQFELRPAWPEHTDAVFEAVRESLPELITWATWCHADYAPGETEAFLRQSLADWHEGKAYNFLIFERGTDRMLGSCGVNEINRLALRANLGYWVRSSATRRGVATAAARLVARFALTELDLLRVEIVAAVGNVASQRVAEKVGATREGILRNRIRVRSVQFDGVGYSLTPADLPRLAE